MSESGNCMSDSQEGVTHIFTKSNLLKIQNNWKQEKYLSIPLSVEFTRYTKSITINYYLLF